ncbi:hypothetical protein IFM89_031896 [Coptis chinensis]|uniref:Succinate dehydrogenase subunit 5, mitochondrial n=1 Tax=Coptis chinensis TaxID=261450 RepID=A0A835MAJ0_9MAGN|nr:hypothetical protein IFM89_031896 [Coptis chinensis]
MERVALLRCLYRSSTRFIASRYTTNKNQQFCHGFHRYITPHRNITTNVSFVNPIGIGSIRSFCEDVTYLPVIRDPNIENVFKDLMDTSWDDLSDAIIDDAKNALSKNTKDRTGREVLVDVFRAAEAVEEFGRILVTLRMEIDDFIGMSGEKIGPLPNEHEEALLEVHKRYEAYLDAFGPDEIYLQKKVETELGAKMNLLKMRCSFLDAEWGKVNIHSS